VEYRINKQNSSAYQIKTVRKGQAQWLTPVIPATLEAELGRTYVKPSPGN
jgi:hypothetical protein